jgi:hypothetical protein
MQAPGPEAFFESHAFTEGDVLDDGRSESQAQAEDEV